MKNLTIMLAVFASSVVAVSCSSDNDDLSNNNETQETLIEKSFTVGTPSSATRAVVRNDDEYSINDQNPAVDWETTDKLLVWGGSSTPGIFSYVEGQTVDPDYLNYAEFAGKVTKIATGGKYYVMYPYQSDATIENGVISATLPSEQKATASSFDPSAALCTGAANGTEKSISIMHTCAFLKITLGDANCTSVEIAAGKRTNGDQQYLAGGVKITTSSDGSKITDFMSTATGTVKLIPSSGTTIAAGTYLISVVPSTSFPGATVTVHFKDNKKKTATLSLTQLNAANVYNLGSVSE